MGPAEAGGKSSPAALMRVSAGRRHKGRMAVRQVLHDLHDELLLRARRHGGELTASRVMSADARAPFL